MTVTPGTGQALKRFGRSLIGGVVITWSLSLFIDIVDIFVGNQDLLLLQRLPLAWILYWPKLFLHAGPHISDLDRGVSSLVDTILCAVLVYGVCTIRARRDRRANHHKGG